MAQPVDRADPELAAACREPAGAGHGKHHLGESAQARLWLDKSREWLEAVRQESPAEVVPTFWRPHDWLACELLRGEAERLLDAESCPCAGNRNRPHRPLTNRP